MTRPSYAKGAERARRIIAARDAGLMPSAIALQFELSVEAVRAVLRGKSYRRVSRSFPIDAATALADAEGALNRRLDVITAHSRRRRAARGEVAA